MKNMRYKFIDGIDEETGQERHLHTLDGKPLIGTSGVLNVIAKPLTWWASGLAVTELGWSPIKDKDKRFISKELRLPIAEKRLEEIKGMDAEEYLKTLDKGYYAHSKTLDKSATKGTNMHAILEKICKRLPLSDREAEHPAAICFREWANKNIKRVISSEGHCYSEEYWLGGITDLVFEDMEGRIAIMDFKSSKEVYRTQLWQCAGYDLQIAENGIVDKEGNQICKLEKPISYYAVFPFGATNPEPEISYDTESAKEAFLAALTIQNKLNN